jgi:hypothetical protein
MHLIQLELLAAALASTESFGRRHPADRSVESVVNQLRFLIDLEEGKRFDWERLKDITIGVLTVREIEPLDNSLAELLYKVVEEVSQMQSRRESKRERS